MSDPKVCRHAHGEYSDDYRRCLDCEMEWVRLGAEWFPVEGWIQLSTKFLEDECKGKAHE